MEGPGLSRWSLWGWDEWKRETAVFLHFQRPLLVLLSLLLFQCCSLFLPQFCDPSTQLFCIRNCQYTTTSREFLAMADLSNNARPKPKGILRYSTRPPKDPEYEMFSMPKLSNSSQGIVIAIEETTPSKFVLSAPPKAYLSKSKASESTPMPITSTSAEKPFERGEQKTSAPPSRLPTRPLNHAVSPIKERSMTPARIGSPALVRSNSAPSTGLNSPVSPVMRSMFPRYDHNLPLARQLYYPSNPSNRGSANETPRSSAYSGSVHSQTETLGTNILKTVPGGPRNVPHHASRISPKASEHSEIVHKPSLSTPEELLDLWSVANGQGSQEAADIYTLGLSW